MDASGDTGLTADETVSFERHDHLVHRGRADLEVALHIGVGVDEGQVLALLFGEAFSPPR